MSVFPLCLSVCLCVSTFSFFKKERKKSVFAFHFFEQLRFFFLSFLVVVGDVRFSFFKLCIILPPPPPPPLYIFFLFFIFIFLFAKHSFVGLLFKNIHPSLQYLSRSLIHASLYEFIIIIIYLFLYLFFTYTSCTIPLPLGHSVNNFRF